ncbi:MAG: cyclophilin-like fold protein [Bryobacterales bacterium]
MSNEPVAMVNFLVGDIEVRCEWNDSPTSRKIREALPLEASASYWGGELYFEIPVEAAQESGAREEVEPGSVAYWPAGRALCIFWGVTPASHGNECRAASPVNVVGRVLNPEVLRKLRAKEVRVTAAG